MPDIIKLDMDNFQVVKNAHGEGTKTSKLIALVPFKKGDMIASFKETSTETSVIRYTSVQVDVDKHIELNSDLVYMNHSCDPNVFVDTKSMKCFAAKNVNANDELTFFYPSTEWEMSAPFDCWCGAENCLRKVNGAKFLGSESLAKFVVNEHILELKKNQI